MRASAPLGEGVARLASDDEYAVATQAGVDKLSVDESLPTGT